MQTVSNLNELSDIIVGYVNNNKSKYNISYSETFSSIKELIDGLELEYNALDEADGTQVTDIAKKVDYGKLVKPFKRGKKLKTNIVESNDPIEDDVKRDLGVEPGSDEEFDFDSLYDKIIGGYYCSECGELINNITDFKKKYFKGSGTEYYCPFCGESYTFEDLEKLKFYETDIDSAKLRTAYQGNGVKMASTFDEPEVYEKQLSNSSLIDSLLTLEKVVYESNITDDLLSNFKDLQLLNIELGRLEGSLEGKGFISHEDGQALSDRGFAKSVSGSDFDFVFDKDDLSKAILTIRSSIEGQDDLLAHLDKIEDILLGYVK